MKYKKHIFICTNQRSPDARICCGEEHGMKLVKEFKRIIKDKGLNIDMRAQRAGCFDLCEKGPSVVVYPEGVFYSKVEIEDVNEIVEKHLENDEVVQRLIMDYKSN